MTDEELRNQVALVCMMVSNPSGGVYPDGWKQRVNDLLRFQRDELLEARATIREMALQTLSDAGQMSDLQDEVERLREALKDTASRAHAALSREVGAA